MSELACCDTVSRCQRRDGCQQPLTPAKKLKQKYEQLLTVRNECEMKRKMSIAGFTVSAVKIVHKL